MAIRASRHLQVFPRSADDPTPGQWTASQEVVVQDSPDPPARPSPEQWSVTRERLSRAARAATRLHPDPVGEWISRELRALAELGLTLDPDGLTARVIEHLLADSDGPGAW
jgi:hypothetical protein